MRNAMVLIMVCLGTAGANGEAAAPKLVVANKRHDRCTSRRTIGEGGLAAGASGPGCRPAPPRGNVAQATTPACCAAGRSPQWLGAGTCDPFESKARVCDPSLAGYPEIPQ